MKFTLMIPTLNEIEGMKVIMPQIKPEWVDEILIVDGGTDGSYEYALQMGYRAIKQKSKGLIGAYQDGVAAAKGDVIITFSPDGNSLAEAIPDLVAKMKEGYDMVIVSRYMAGARSEDDDPVTAFGNWMFTKMINVAFGANYTDSLVMFRAWKKELFKSVPVWVARASLEPNICMKCAKRKLKVGEIPGSEPPRIGGIRKMSPLANGSAILGCIIMEFFSGQE